MTYYKHVLQSLRENIPLKMSRAMTIPNMCSKENIIRSDWIVPLDTHVSILFGSNGKYYTYLTIKYQEEVVYAVSFIKDVSMQTLINLIYKFMEP